VGVGGSPSPVRAHRSTFPASRVITHAPTHHTQQPITDTVSGRILLVTPSSRHARLADVEKFKFLLIKADQNQSSWTVGSVLSRKLSLILSYAR